MIVSVSPFLWCTLSVPIVLSLPHAPSEGSGGVRLTARAGMRGARENRGAPRGIESSRNWTSRNWSEWLMIRSEKIR